MAVWWVFPSPSHIEALFAIAISAYVLLSNLSRREIWPALWMIIAASVAEGLISKYLFEDKTTVGQLKYFLSIMFFDFGLSFILWAYHCNGHLLQLAGASIKRPFIPQVVGMSMILMFSALMTLPVLLELLVHYFDDKYFESVPFFYHHHATMTNIAHCLVNVAIWSMMLDAHYLQERRSRQKDSVIGL